MWSTYILCSVLKKELAPFWLFFSGILGGIGFVLKATSVISLIAAFLAVFFVLSPRLIKYIKSAICVAIGGIAVLVLTQLLWIQFPCSEMEYEYSAPLEYWIALGSVADGGYGANEEFAVSCLTTSGKDAKRKVAREYISAHWEELWSMPHWISKMRRNFASGNMGLSTYINDEDSLAYNLFNDYGEYGGYMTMFTTGYFYALLFLGVIGCLASCGGQGESDASGDWQLFLMLLTALTVLGIFLFLMLWEANNRQLYNHMPWFALLGALGCSRILSVRHLDCTVNDGQKQ